MKRYYKTWEIAFWGELTIQGVHWRAKKLRLKPKGTTVKKWSLKQAEKILNIKTP